MALKAKTKEPRRVHLDVWQGEGRRLYGDNVATWKFRCPSCGHVQTAMDFKSYGVPIRSIDTRLAFSCIGRSIAELHPALPVAEMWGTDLGYGCNYAGGGLFRINPTVIVFGIAKETGEEATRPVFDWADPLPTGGSHDHQPEGRERSGEVNGHPEGP